MPRKIGTIEESTPLLPYVVADCVIGEVETHVNDCIPFGDHEKLADYLTTKMNHLFQVNETFRKKIRGNSGREYLYCFMRHWLSAELYKRPGMREKIPAHFANGLPIGR